MRSPYLCMGYDNYVVNSSDIRYNFVVLLWFNCKENRCLYSSSVLLMLYFVCIAKRKIFKLCFFLHAIILRVSSKIYNLVHFITFFCSHEIHIILPGLFYNTRTEFTIANRHFDDDVNNFVKICTSYMLLVGNFSSNKCLKINSYNFFTFCFLLIL